MFVDFFYKLKSVGIPVSPTSFLTLHKALGSGLVNSLEDFYTAARAVPPRAAILLAGKWQLKRLPSPTRLSTSSVAL